jgi:hypothetical protein
VPAVTTDAAVIAVLAKVKLLLSAVQAASVPGVAGVSCGSAAAGVDGVVVGGFDVGVDESLPPQAVNKNAVIVRATAKRECTSIGVSF